jgi:hypothetical protein
LWVFSTLGLKELFLQYILTLSKFTKHGLSHLRRSREPLPLAEASPYTKEPDL